MLKDTFMINFHNFCATIALFIIINVSYAAEPSAFVTINSDIHQPLQLKIDKRGYGRDIYAAYLEKTYELEMQQRCLEKWGQKIENSKRVYQPHYFFVLLDGGRVLLPNEEYNHEYLKGAFSVVIPEIIWINMTHASPDVYDRTRTYDIKQVGANIWRYWFDWLDETGIHLLK